jgi:hypothetical protein
MIKYFFCFVFVLTKLFADAQLATPGGQAPYKNKNLSPEARAKDLLSRMNLDEKVMQTQCLWIQKSRILNDRGILMKSRQKKI